MPFARQELRPKGGGGKTPAPLVDVGREFRDLLTTQLSRLATRAAALGATPERPMPVKVRLHPRALAKSNRPYALLDRSGIPVVAAERIGELIVPATAVRLRQLAAAVSSASSKADKYAISTLDSLAEWDESDVFSANGVAEAERVVEIARTNGRLLKITFFPWVSTRDVGTAEGGRSVARGIATDGGALTLTRDDFQTANLELYSTDANPRRPVVFAQVNERTSVQSLRSVPGVRSVALAEEYDTGFDSTPQFHAPIRILDASELRTVDRASPMVGVLDSGIASSLLDPWIVDRLNYDVGADYDPGHGTFAAGLIVDSRGLNGEDAYPADSARVIDAQVMPGAGISEAILHDRVVEVVTDPAMSDVKVWNCSFGAPRQGQPAYGTFAQELDAISDRYGVLFVIAAGNYGGQPPRGWPPSAGLENRLSSPSESIRSLTVGARSRLGGMVAPGQPSSYSQRGPNFAAHVKPELCHWAGDFDANGALSGFGIRSIVSSNVLAEAVGTSFAAPLVSATAANTWQMLQSGGAVQNVRPELVKGLLVHGAVLTDVSTQPEHRDYYGWGVPPSSSEILGDDASSFTSIHEVTLTPGTTWLKEPFPVPDCLIVDGNKFRGEVILTVAYAPPLDPAFGDECVRYEVEGAFGSVQPTGTGSSRFRGITPGERPPSELWEASQIAEGKWAPIKTYRRRAPDGISGGSWALRLSLTERVSNEVQVPQLVYAIITFRSLESGQPVYQNGVEAVRRLNYESRLVVPAARLRV